MRHHYNLDRIISEYSPLYLTIILPSFSDRPDSPTLTADVGSPTDGDSIVLTCTTTSSGVTSYEFFRGSTSLVKSSNNQYTISASAIGTDDGCYICVAFIDGVASHASTANLILCK